MPHGPDGPIATWCRWTSASAPMWTPPACGSAKWPMAPQDIALRARHDPAAGGAGPGDGHRAWWPELKEQGYQLLATGEMGIGNTTTSQRGGRRACWARPGGGGDRPGGRPVHRAACSRKIQVIRQAIERSTGPTRRTRWTCCAKWGAAILRAWPGVCLGGALYQVSRCLLDGLISAVAALCAAAAVPGQPVRHGGQPRFRRTRRRHAAGGAGAEALDLRRACAWARAPAPWPPCPCWIWPMTIYHAMSTFDDIHMEGYTHQE